MRRSGRIADYYRAGGHILRHHRPHADDRAAPDAQRLVRRPLFQHRAGPDIDVVLDHRIAVHADARGQGDEVADDAVMTAT